MDWVTLLVNLITTFLTVGGLGTVIYYRQNRDKKEIENRYSIENSQREELSRKDIQIIELEKKCDGLSKQKDYYMQQCSDLQNTVIHATCFKCNNWTCINRVPPMEDINREMETLSLKYKRDNNVSNTEININKNEVE